MPINLRYRLRELSDKRLARELHDMIARSDQLNAECAPIRFWDHLMMRFAPVRMKRPFVHHRRPYPAKAALFILCSAGEGCWALPTMFWIISAQARKEIWRPCSLYIAGCELEDLLNETERRLQRRRKRSTSGT